LDFLGSRTFLFCALSNIYLLDIKSKILAIGLFKLTLFFIAVRLIRAGVDYFSLIDLVFSLRRRIDLNLTGNLPPLLL
jgi:hypothetical protein